MATVVIEMQESAPFYVRRGWANVLESIGMNVVEWWFEKEAAFDLFNRAPDCSLFIGTTYNFNRALDKIIRSRPFMKVALYASAWGQLVDNLDYPIVKVGSEEKQVLGKLYKDMKKPDCVFLHITEQQLEGSLGGWKYGLGIPVLGLLLGADLFSYYGAKPEDKYKCDIGFVGSRWPYKAKTLDKYLTKYCNEQWKRKNVKVFGGGGWDLPQYLGQLAYGEDSKVFASATICPNISEEHSYAIQDLIERIFKVPCSDGFLICDNVDLTETGLKGIVPQFSNYEDFVTLTDYFLRPENNTERLGLISKQKSCIVYQHSYHERMYKLLKTLNFHVEAEAVLTRKKEQFGLSSIYTEAT